MTSLVALWKSWSWTKCFRGRDKSHNVLHWSQEFCFHFVQQMKNVTIYCICITGKHLTESFLSASQAYKSMMRSRIDWWAKARKAGEEGNKHGRESEVTHCHWSDCAFRNKVSPEVFLLSKPGLGATNASQTEKRGTKPWLVFNYKYNVKLTSIFL